MRERLETLEANGVTPAATPAPPPLPQVEQAPPSAPAAAPEPAPAMATEAAPPEAEAAASAPPPPLPPAEAGFEERIGTRWVVWIGGLTLALGGFFLVRYSIEAGLLGPNVRVALGGLFALALLGAGEWTRRKESISDIVALPIANIPAILTAAGTAVAFATVYAAYALYGFLAPATAFILLGMVALGTLAAALLHGPALAGLGVAAGFVTPLLVSSEKPDYLGALRLSRHRHRGSAGAGAHPPVALACDHDHCLCTALDPALPRLRPVDGRTTRLPRHRRLHPR